MPNRRITGRQGNNSRIWRSGPNRLLIRYHKCSQKQVPKEYLTSPDHAPEKAQFTIDYSNKRLKVRLLANYKNWKIWGPNLSSRRKQVEIRRRKHFPSSSCRKRTQKTINRTIRWTNNQLTKEVTSTWPCQKINRCGLKINRIVCGRSQLTIKNRSHSLSIGIMKGRMRRKGRTSRPTRIRLSISSQCPLIYTLICLHSIWIRWSRQINRSIKRFRYCRRTKNRLSIGRRLTVKINSVQRLGVGPKLCSYKSLASMIRTGGRDRLLG